MVQNKNKILNSKFSKKNGTPEELNANLKQTTTAKRSLFARNTSWSDLPSQAGADLENSGGRGMAHTQASKCW